MKMILYVILVMGILAVVTLYGLRLWVYNQAVEAGREAQATYPGDGIEALIAMLESDESTVKEKNHAIWALGHLRDERAVPALEKVYTGEDCNEDHNLCQYELQKALPNCRGETFDIMFWK